MSDLIVSKGGWLEHSGKRYRCAIGKAGITAAKREGDHATPAGRFPLRQGYYRSDRLALPQTLIPFHEIREEDGWCDDPASAFYNRKIRCPFEASHEKLRRHDGQYDVLVVLGYNDDPVTRRLGSAIFLHVAKPDYSGTEGCVALALDDLLEVLKEVKPGDFLTVIDV